MKETLTKTQVPEIVAEPEASERAASWLRGLAARGITSRLVNGRLRHFPGAAYKLLTDDEVLTLRHHRAAIKELVKVGIPLDVVRAASTAEKVTPEPAPEPVPPPAPCRYCNQSPAACAELKVSRLDVWRTLHSLDLDEVARKNAEATALMMMQVGKPPRW